MHAIIRYSVVQPGWKLEMHTPHLVSHTCLNGCLHSKKSATIGKIAQILRHAILIVDPVLVLWRKGAGQALGKRGKHPEKLPLNSFQEIKKPCITTSGGPILCVLPFFLPFFFPSMIFSLTPPIKVGCAENNHDLAPFC